MEEMILRYEPSQKQTLELLEMVKRLVCVTRCMNRRRSYHFLYQISRWEQGIAGQGSPPRFNIKTAWHVAQVYLQTLTKYQWIRLAPAPAERIIKEFLGIMRSGSRTRHHARGVYIGKRRKSQVKGLTMDEKLFALSLCLPFLTLAERVLQFALVCQKTYKAAFTLFYHSTVDFGLPFMRRLMLEPVFLKRLIIPLGRTLAVARLHCVEHFVLISILGDSLTDLTLDHIPSPLESTKSHHAAFSLDVFTQSIEYLAKRCTSLESLTLYFNNEFPFYCNTTMSASQQVPSHDLSSYTLMEKLSSYTPAIFPTLRSLTLVDVVSMHPLNVLLSARFPVLRNLSVSSTPLFPTSCLADFLYQGSKLWFNVGYDQRCFVDPGVGYHGLSYTQHQPVLDQCQCRVNGFHTLIVNHCSNIANEMLFDAILNQRFLKVLRLASSTSFKRDVTFSHPSLQELYVDYDFGKSWTLCCKALKRVVFICRNEYECDSQRCVTRIQLIERLNEWFERHREVCVELRCVAVECKFSSEFNFDLASLYH